VDRAVLSIRKRKKYFSCDKMDAKLQLGDTDHAVHTSDRFAASRAALGEQFTKAVGAVRLVVARSKPLACQRLLAVGAGEALPMPGVVAVGDTSLRDDLHRGHENRG
jgi:hypothetical protein